MLLHRGSNVLWCRFHALKPRIQDKTSPAFLAVVNLYVSVIVVPYPIFNNLGRTAVCTEIRSCIDRCDSLYSFNLFADGKREFHGDDVFALNTPQLVIRAIA